MSAWDQQRVVAAVLRWAEIHDRPPRMRDWKGGQGDEFPGTRTVTRHCGSFNQALELAGFPVRKVAKHEEAVRIAAVQAYEAGEAPGQIAERLELAQSSVVGWVAQAGATRRGACQVCGRAISDPPRRGRPRQYCGPCRPVRVYEPVKNPSRPCQVCGKLMEAPHKGRLYCSSGCARQAAWQRNVEAQAA